MRIGSYDVSAVDTGRIWLDGGSMFGTVPRVLWEKKSPPDEKHRIELAMRALLLVGEGRKILVDCGVGDKGGEKFKEMFRTSDRLEAALAEKGLTPADVTDVILTHLHFDHAGGATVRNRDGAYVPRFPNATYYLQKRNLDTARNPNPRERASYLPENFEALLSAKRLRVLEGNKPLFPQIDLFVSFGHTEAQQHVVVSDGKTSLFYGGDLIPTSAHVPLAWIMGYDLHPLKMLEEKEQILSRSSKEQWILFYEHDPVVAATRVASGKGGWVAGDEVRL